MDNARLTGPQEAETLAKPEQQLAEMRREPNTDSHDSVLGVPRKFHATITDEQALKLKLVMVQEATELVGRPRENK